MSAAGLRRKKKKEKKILALSGISWLNKGSSRRQGFPIQSTHHPTHPHRHTHTYALNYSRDPLGLQFITPSSRPQLPQAAGCVLLLKEAPLMQCYISRSKRQKSQTTVHQRQLKKKKSKALKTISFNVTFSLYSELKMVKLRSSGPWHGYWAHLRRGEADTHFSL